MKLTKAEQNKIDKALDQLDISHFDIHNLIEVVEELPAPAAWVQDKTTGKCSIFIRKDTLKWSVPFIVFALRHELLHHRAFKGQHFIETSDHAVMNLTLDVAVNWVLYYSCMDDAIHFTKFFYLPMVQQNNDSPFILMLMPSLTFLARNMNQDYLNLNKEIWQSSSIPNVVHIYLSLLGDPNIKQQTLEGYYYRGEGATTEEIDKSPGFGEIEEQVEKFAAGAGKENIFDKLDINSAQCSAREIENLILKFETQKAVQPIVNFLYSFILEDERVDVYPLNPTSQSLVFTAAGISKYTRLFYNNVDRTVPNISFYIDVSGSMTMYYPYEVEIVKQLRACLPTRIFAFSVDILEIETEDFAKGKIPKGSGTCFNNMIKHIIDKGEQVNVVLTDGEDTVTTDMVQLFKESRKEVYVVYINPNSNNQYYYGSLDPIATSTIEVKIDVKCSER
jgi:hypothetical protein